MDDDSDDDSEDGKKEVSLLERWRLRRMGERLTEAGSNEYKEGETSGGEEDNDRWRSDDENVDERFCLVGRKSESGVRGENDDHDPHVGKDDSGWMGGDSVVSEEGQAGEIVDGKASGIAEEDMEQATAANGAMRCKTPYGVRQLCNTSVSERDVWQSWLVSVKDRDAGKMGLVSVTERDPRASWLVSVKDRHASELWLVSVKDRDVVARVRDDGERSHPIMRRFGPGDRPLSVR